MKEVATLLFLLLFIALGNAQEIKIKTESVSLENLIPFIAENYSSQESATLHNITFLIQVGNTGISNDDKVILKQAFKLLSKRLTKNDLISIIGYSGINGLALEQASPKKTKPILHTINNFMSSINEFHKDGIELAYTYAKQNYSEGAVNTIIMIRNPNASSGAVVNQITESESIPTETLAPKSKNNAVLLTAITLLPEIISIIKD
jgi:hypothetical protein